MCVFGGFHAFFDGLICGDDAGVIGSVEFFSDFGIGEVGEFAGECNDEAAGENDTAVA